MYIFVVVLFRLIYIDCFYLDAHISMGRVNTRKTVFVVVLMCVCQYAQPTPLVDGIQEHEKYGNNGDKFYGAGRALVNTYEGFSNILNKVVDVS